MRYFPSGADASENMMILDSTNYPDAMLSYYYSFYRKSDDRIKRPISFSERKNIFLDSGGFTARIKGIDLDVNEYAKFIDKYGYLFFKISNLDVMDWNQSQKNFQILRNTRYGDRVIQIYHANDYAKGLTKEYINLVKKEDFIGLGGIAGEKWNKSAVRKFQNFAFYHAIKNQCKIHGFGMMSDFNVKTYPFYSVDSTSWLQAGRWGSVIYFNGKKLIAKRKSNAHDKSGSKLTRITPYAYVHRIPATVKSLESYEKYCQYITDLWKTKGISWTI